MHAPVLLKEVIELLDPKSGEFFVDGTVGSGGHATAVIQKMLPRGKFLAIDWDEGHLNKSRESIEKDLPVPSQQFPMFWEKSNYSKITEILQEKNLGLVDGLLVDLGFSSEHLISSRGFSFQKNEPLLMTYDTRAEPLKQILKELTEEEIFTIIKEFGEERFAGSIAKAIYERVRHGAIETSGELAEIVKNAVPRGYERGRIHPATRTFQAFRIYVNHELENLERILKDLPVIMKPEGRVAIISFHSLEDRLVKNYFRDYDKAGRMKILTKKPIQATRDEIISNPRSRSAKLRVARFIQ